MLYSVRSGKVKVKLSEKLKAELLEDPPAELNFDEEQNMISLNFKGEGFDLDDYKRFFACAEEPGVFMVFFEDHKGADQYGVEYGPNYCEEE